MTHPLTGAVRRALPRPLSAAHRRYLALLDRRLVAAERAARAGEVRRRREAKATRAQARRFLAPRLGAWSDGDENLVRGHLDAWPRPRVDADRGAALAVAECARALAAIDPPPSTLWFFLWEMESMLESGAFVSRPKVPGGR